MLDKVLDKVFDLRHKRDEIQLALKAIDATKTPHLEKLEFIEAELSEAQDKVLEAMENKNIKTYTYGINNVTMAVRKTLGIVDEQVFIENLQSQGSKLAKAIGMKMRDIKANMFVKSLNKPFAKEIADSYLKVEGKVFPGSDVKETKYLTIK